MPWLPFADAQKLREFSPITKGNSIESLCVRPLPRYRRTIARREPRVSTSRHTDKSGSFSDPAKMERIVTGTNPKKCVNMATWNVGPHSCMQETRGTARTPSRHLHEQNHGTFQATSCRRHLRKAKRHPPRKRTITNSRNGAAISRSSKPLPASSVLQSLRRYGQTMAAACNDGLPEACASVVP